MSDWLPETPRTLTFPTAAYVTLAGADWLASASPHPHTVQSLWASRPDAPGVLPCGTVFDVINAPALFGRHMVDRLWSAGPGSGPVAAHRGRILLFTAPGTAQRLPALLGWEEWARAVPPLLCHGSGDAVTVPPLHPGHAADDAEGGSPSGSRWLVAPDVRHPWLPGPDVLLWACVRAARCAVDEEHETAPQVQVPALAPG
ncbi:bifunctional DNA primase/polymerase [Streptomyces sp. NPDC048650]|uniref:bifunctional DNA primase/polymerase n=1 Tax=unclassified Streptomyces TaxID=2593676 RepID=UPI003714CAC0